MTTSLTTNFPNGVTNAASTSSMGTLIQLDPTKLHIYFNDFNLYDASDWNVTSGGSAIQAISDEDGGILELQTNTSDRNIFMLLTNKTFQFVSGKKLYFKARFKVLDVADFTFNAIGLSNANLSNAIFFIIFDGVFFIRLVKNSLTLTTTIIDIPSNDTYFEVAFIYDGESEVSYWLDGIKLGTLGVDHLPDDTLAILLSTDIGDVPLSQVMSTDYIYVANER